MPHFKASFTRRKTGTDHAQTPQGFYWRQKCSDSRDLLDDSMGTPTDQPLWPLEAGRTSGNPGKKKKRRKGDAYTARRFDTAARVPKRPCLATNHASTKKQLQRRRRTNYHVIFFLPNANGIVPFRHPCRRKGSGDGAPWTGCVQGRPEVSGAGFHPSLGPVWPSYRTPSVVSSPCVVRPAHTNSRAR